MSRQMPEQNEKGIRSERNYKGCERTLWNIREVLCGKRGPRNVNKKFLIYLLSIDGGLNGAEIGRMLEMHQSSVSKAVSGLEKQVKVVRGINTISKICRRNFAVLNKALIK
jgi:hypothetical protein